MSIYVLYAWIQLKTAVGPVTKYSETKVQCTGLVDCNKKIREAETGLIDNGWHIYKSGYVGNAPTIPTLPDLD